MLKLERWDRLKRGGLPESVATPRVGDRAGHGPRSARSFQHLRRVARVSVARASSRAATEREVFHLAWPIAVAMLGETAIGLVDTFLVSGLGAEQLGGVGLATTFMYLGYSVVFGVTRGVKVKVAHAIGEGAPERAPRYLAAGLTISLVIGALVFAFGRDASWLLSRIGTDPAIVPHAKVSLAAVTWGAPFTCAMAALTQYRQGLGDTRWPMVVTIAGNVLHAVLAWSLIYGHLGLPALGVPGAGYATAVTELVEVVALGAVVLRDLRVGPESALPLRRALREVCELGVPTGLQFGAEMLAFTTFTAILSSMGPREIAAHQIAIYVLRASFLPGIAVSEAGSVLIGKALGAREVPRADRVHVAATRLAVGFMAACGLLFALTGAKIAGLFTPDPGIVRVARNLLLVAAVFQVLDAASIVLRASLRAAKDVRVVAVVGITVAWTCIPTFAWVLGKHAGLGALGGWLGFVAETGIGACVFYMRWKRGGWRARYAPLE